jgi:hypothetical protein
MSAKLLAAITRGRVDVIAHLYPAFLIAESNVSCLFHPCSEATSGRYVADSVRAPLLDETFFLDAPARLDSLFRRPLVSLEVLDSVEDMDAGESVGAGARYAGSSK